MKRNLLPFNKKIVNLNSPPRGFVFFDSICNCIGADNKWNNSLYRINGKVSLQFSTVLKTDRANKQAFLRLAGDEEFGNVLPIAIANGFWEGNQPLTIETGIVNGSMAPVANLTIENSKMSSSSSPRGIFKGDLRGAIAGTIGKTGDRPISGTTLWNLSNFSALRLYQKTIVLGSFSNRSTLPVVIGGNLEGLAGCYCQNSGTIVENSKIQHKTAVTFADNRGNWVTLITLNDDLYVILFEEERNLNSNAMKTDRVTPKSKSALDEVTLTMTETDNSCAQLTASPPKAMGTAQSGYAVLQYNGTEDLNLTYGDSEDSAIVSRPELHAEPIVWNGGGADNYWSNPQNWSGDRIPTHCDRVIFDGTSSKNVILNICPQIQSLTMTSDYSGTLSGWNDLLVSEDVRIQGGTLKVNLEAGGDLTIENGTVNGYLDIGGNLAIQNGTVAWCGGKVAGNVFLSGGEVGFSSEYNSYYILYGNFTRAGGTVSGKPIFCFQGSSPQIFEPGSGGMTLRDLYNFSELILKGDVTLRDIFSNDGTFTVAMGATLDAREVHLFSNNGAIAQDGTLLHSEPTARADTDANSVTSNTSGNLLYLHPIKEDNTFQKKVIDSSQITVKNAVAREEVTLNLNIGEPSIAPNINHRPTTTGAANFGENIRQHEAIGELKNSFGDSKYSTDTKIYPYHTAAVV